MPQTVLVVDDDPVTLEVARERLERAGYTVVVRDVAIGTSEWIVEHAPDVVLLDESMPALSGSVVAQILKRRRLRTTVILHSSLSREALADLARASGAAGAIQKTSSDTQFQREFERIVGRRRPA
jgi:two-component system response regulator PrrA